MGQMCMTDAGTTQDIGHTHLNKWIRHIFLFLSYWTFSCKTCINFMSRCNCIRNVACSVPAIEEWLLNQVRNKLHFLFFSSFVLGFVCFFVCLFLFVLFVVVVFLFVVVLLFFWSSCRFNLDK